MKIIEDSIQIIKKQLLDIVAIYIFGSFSTAFETPSSDLDIAILSSKKLDSVFLWKLSQEISYITKKDVDLVDFLNISTIFAFQIINEGKLVYCTNKIKYAFFENSIDSKYLELNQIRKYIIEEIKNRKRIY